MATRGCAGCGEAFEIGPRERNKRRWCSEKCRVRAYRNSNAEYRARAARQAAERHRATYVPVRHEVTCVVCGRDFNSARSNARYCSGRCRFRQHYQSRRGRHASVPREPYMLQEIAERDGWTCQLCGGDVPKAGRWPAPLSPSLDHVIPLVDHGPDVPENVQLTHLVCNLRKGRKSAGSATAALQAGMPTG